VSLEKIDAVVVGAGVIGLACARGLAAKGLETVIIEVNNSYGQGVSSRNSEVIHAGIYYPSGTLKASLCVSGRHTLYSYCEEKFIPYIRCGKLIVSNSPEQEKKLLQLFDQAQKNGVTDVQLISAKQAMQLEPALTCTAALLSPSTGIIDSHSLMNALLWDAQSRGASLAVRSRFIGAEALGDGYLSMVGIGDEIVEIKSSILINAAGLDAPKVASNISNPNPSLLPKAYLAKGSYFYLSGRSPFSRLIYPVPEPGGLGVHLTIDLGGQSKFGPDVEWVDELNYEVDPKRSETFYSSIRQYWKGLPDNALHPAYSGIRPKIVGKGETDADFLIQGPQEHGCSGLVNLFGIESPGLTSSFAISDHVIDKLGLQ
jgi:L-2-hydroxyglutarate oxidase LhgO